MIYLFKYSVGYIISQLSSKHPPILDCSLSTFVFLQFEPDCLRFERQSKVEHQQVGTYHSLGMSWEQILEEMAACRTAWGRLAGCWGKLFSNGSTNPLTDLSPTKVWFTMWRSCTVLSLGYPARPWVGPIFQRKPAKRCISRRFEH